MVSGAKWLRVEDVTKEYAAGGAEREGKDGACANAVLCGASFVAGKGETVAIVGPSGSGKSTLLNIIGGLDSPTSGAVWLGDEEVTRLQGRALERLRAERVGFVFQEHHLLPQLTAVENVMLPTMAVGAGRETAAERAGALLERVGVAHRRDAFPSAMSGGERQRVAIARALVNGAGLLLCDEPTGNLDADTGARVVELFLELARSEGATVVMVTHNAEHSGRLGRTLRLHGGRLEAGGAS